MALRCVTNPAVIATPFMTLFSIYVNVVAVPISTTIAVSAYSLITAFALDTKSAPASFGLSAIILRRLFVETIVYVLSGHHIVPSPRQVVLSDLYPEHQNK